MVMALHAGYRMGRCQAWLERGRVHGKPPCIPAPYAPIPIVHAHDAMSMAPISQDALCIDWMVQGGRQ